MTDIACADEAALGVEARLAAHAFQAFVTVSAHPVVAGIQLVAAVAETLWHRIAAGICGGGTTMVTACIAAHVGGSVVYYTGTW